MQIVARLDSNYHAHLLGLINCSQFNRAKRARYSLGDTGNRGSISHWLGLEALAVSDQIEEKEMR